MVEISDKKKSKEKLPGQTKWVLIIEDDFFIVKAYSAKFSHEGIAHKIAQDGEEGLEMLKSNNLPSLILLDLMLPKKNGFEILEEINKQNPRFKDIPVLILTNLAQQADAKRGINLGAKEYLVKADLKIEVLIKKVKQYLSIGVNA